MSTTYKIHPSIGIARVGNSDDYYLAPTAAGGLPLEQDGRTPVTRFRDANALLRKQAATFQVYAYDDGAQNGRPVTIGQDNIKDIQWTVHLANKKASWRAFKQLEGSEGYSSDHPWRNPAVPGDARKQLIIDPGPRAINCVSAPTQADFSRGTGPAGYPQTFPPTDLSPFSIDTLGRVMAQADGSLRVLGGNGNSGVGAAYCLSTAVLKSLVPNQPLPAYIIGLLGYVADHGFANLAQFQGALRFYLEQTDYQHWHETIEGYAREPRIDAYANNDFWYDDTSDGPVTATLIMQDGTQVAVDVPAWVLVAPPAFAPQILNMVTLYDTMYDVFVRYFDYNPALFSNGSFNSGYIPDYQTEILPILQRPRVYQWVANIVQWARKSHDGLVENPAQPTFLQHVRSPEATNVGGTPPLMPYLAGDNPINQTLPSNYLSVTATQYFLLQQYCNHTAQSMGGGTSPGTQMGPGEALDRAVLENCVGGPFCPGIEMTWISRNPAIYSAPFRLRHAPLGGGGLHWDNDPAQGGGLEPGDVTRYMAIPWQADFNECSNQNIGSDVYWWWPAQRPYMVYADSNPSEQVSWTRPADVQFNNDRDMVFNWSHMGFVIQQGDGSFLEVQRNDEGIVNSPPTK